MQIGVDLNELAPRALWFRFLLFQWNVFQYPFQRRVIKAVQFLRETGRKMIEERKNAMNEGEEVPDDILQHIIEQQGL